MADDVFHEKDNKNFWERLAMILANGSIGAFHISIREKLDHPGAKLDDLKRVWRMSEKFVFELSNGTSIDIGGGRGAETEAEWQRMLELVFEA